MTLLRSKLFMSLKMKMMPVFLEKMDFVTTASLPRMASLKYPVSTNWSKLVILRIDSKNLKKRL